MTPTSSGNWGVPSLNYRDRQVVSASKEWLADPFTSPAAFVTLTMKQGLKLEDGTWVRLTSEIAEKQLGWLVRELDRKVLGTAATRFKKKMGRIVSLEGVSSDKSLHAHLILEIPPPHRMTAETYFRTIRAIWEKSEWSRREWEYEPCYYTPGAIGYSLKEGLDALLIGLCEPPYFDPKTSTAV